MHLTNQVRLGAIVLLFSFGVFRVHSDEIENPLQAARVASVKASEHIKSAIAVGTYEAFFQAKGAERPTRITKAKVNVYFDQGKYHISIDFEENLQPRQGKIYDKRTPKLAIISDEDNAYVIRFSDRINPTGCSGDIWPTKHSRGAFSRAGFPWREPARLWKDVLDVDGLVRKLGRDAVSFRAAGDGVYQGEYPALKPYAKFEIRRDAGYQVVKHRLYNPKQENPVTTYDLQWARKGDVWYVKRLVKESDRRGLSESGAYMRWVINFDSFEVNEPVDPKFFKVKSVPVPPRTRFTNRDPMANPRFLYFDGEQLTPQRQ